MKRNTIVELSFLKRAKAGELNPYELETFAKWLSQAQENRDFYAKFSRFDADNFTSSLDMNEELEFFVRSMKSVDRRSADRIHRRMHTMRWGLSLAAATVAIAVVAVMTLRDRSTAERAASPTEFAHTVLITEDRMLELDDMALAAIEPAEAKAATDRSIDYRKPESTVANDRIENHRLITPKGETFTVTLSDGTRVWLNSATELSYPSKFTDGERHVTLKGEAYFEIARNAERPFVVNIGEMAVRAYGTEFNVNASGKTIKTVLVKGRIGITSDFEPERETMLRPNEMYELDIESGEHAVRTVDGDFYASWRLGYFIFDNQTIESIMLKLSELYDIRVVYRNPGTRKMRFSGRIRRGDDVSTILALIERTSLLHFSVDDGTVTVD